MKYYSQLIEATFLKRPISFLVEVVLQSKRRIMLRCPNLDPLNGCDILGTQLWFSAPHKDHFLPTLELFEVNGGFLVGINPEILLQLVMEAIRYRYIHELIDYKVVYQRTNYIQNPMPTLLLQKDFLEPCYLCLEHVINVNDQFAAVFPINTLGTRSLDANLEYLILRKKQGYRAILMYCVLHAGAKVLQFPENIQAEYHAKIIKAINQGVEILAYKAKITTEEIELINKIPITIQAVAKH